MREYAVVGLTGVRATIYAKNVSDAKDAALKALNCWPTSVTHILAPRPVRVFRKAKNGNVY